MTARPASSFRSTTALLFLLCGALGLLSTTSQAANVQGSLQKWAPLTLDFSGPVAAETDNQPNPFLDYRLNIVFTSPSGREVLVPGFFAGDGQGGGRGNVWRARFHADETGEWRYRAELRQGSEVAIDLSPGAGQVVALNDGSGVFQIVPQSADAPGFLQFGRLEYVGSHYLKFRDGPYWLKGGTDSPENLLGYNGIDGTIDHGGSFSNFLHDFAPHRADARPEDPTFSNSASGATSTGLIGALNYLSEQAVNSVYFLPMNLGGDGQDVYPFVGASGNRFDNTHYDISKLHQWNQVFEHAQRRGIALHFVLSETEPGNERWLDNGALGVERRLFFRELIARFGHVLAAKWNLGEENDFPVSELRQHASYIKSLDWSRKPVAVHTQINNFRDYEQLVGDPLFDATSIQYDPPLASEFVERWRNRSAQSGRPWVLDMDENTGGVTNGNAETRRKQILYDVYLSGGQLEWYYGLHPTNVGGDVNANDFRTRERVWSFMRHARDFMETHLPFWQMQPADNLVSGEANDFGGAEVFAAPGDVYAVYLPASRGSEQLDLSSASGTFTQRWFNPENGQFDGGSRSVTAGARVALGRAPSRNGDDWVVLLQRDGYSLPAVPRDNDQVTITNEPTPANDQANDQANEPAVPDSDDAAPQSSAPPQFQPIEAQMLTPGTAFRLTVVAVDPDGVAPAMTAADLPPGMRIQGPGDGVLELDWDVPVELSGETEITLIAIDGQDPSIQVQQALTLMAAPVAADAPSPTPQIDPVADESLVSGDAPVLPDVEQTATPPLPANPEPTQLDDSVDKPNHVPELFGAVSRTVMVGEPLQMRLVAVDPDGLVPGLYADELPGSAQLQDNGDGSRTLVWTPAPSDLGDHQVGLMVVDAQDVTVITRRNITLSVIDQTVDTSPAFDTSTPLPGAGSAENFPPVFGQLPAQTAQVGNSFRLRIRPLDPEGIAPHLQWINAPDGAQFVDNGDGSRTVIWIPDASSIGQRTLSFVATDNADVSLSAQLDVQLTVQAQP